MKNLVSRFVKDESGATAIEYGLIAAGISVAIIAVVKGLGTKLNTLVQQPLRPAQVSVVRSSVTRGLRFTGALSHFCGCRARSRCRPPRARPDEQHWDDAAMPWSC